MRKWFQTSWRRTTSVWVAIDVADVSLGLLAWVQDGIQIAGGLVLHWPLFFGIGMFAITMVVWSLAENWITSKRQAKRQAREDFKLEIERIFHQFLAMEPGYYPSPIEGIAQRKLELIAAANLLRNKLTALGYDVPPNGWTIEDESFQRCSALLSTVRMDLA